MFSCFLFCIFELVSNSDMFWCFLFCTLCICFGGWDCVLSPRFGIFWWYEVLGVWLLVSLVSRYCLVATLIFWLFFVSDVQPSFPVCVGQFLPQRFHSETGFNCFFYFNIVGVSFSARSLVSSG